MVSTFNKFNAKVLLLGEHLINLGSDALSIPYDKFNGKLISSGNLNSRLTLFIDFLRSNRFEFLDASKISNTNGLEFSSNIPEGYGCGSSGAIVAACYDYFKSDEIEDPKILKDRFSKMEAFYHGKSSGTDPLISYLNSAIKFNTDSTIQILPELNPKLDNYSLILIDSGNPREGKEYIKWFMNKSKGEDFKSILREKLVPATQNCIVAFLDGDEIGFKNSFATISEIQLDHMDKMIPNHMKDLWIEGIESDKLHLKICGAGGGGFFIGLLKNSSNIKALAEFQTYSLT